LETPAQWQPYIDAWRERWRRRDAQVEQRRLLARQAACGCAAYLAEHWGVSRVYLLGSLAGWGRVHAHSDIDLAAEGLPPGAEYFRVLAELWELLPSGDELDLVPLEEALPGLRDRILREGEVLYDRQ